MANKTVTRSDITNALVKEVGLSQYECDQAVMDVLSQITNSLFDDGEVKLSNFGSFRVAEKKERIARNPKTKEPAVVSARKVVVFKPANNLKRLVAVRSD